MKKSCHRYTNKKELNDQIVELVSEGWTVEACKSKCKLRDPLGNFRLTFHRSPSDRRFLQNALAYIRQARRAYMETCRG